MGWTRAVSIASISPMWLGTGGTVEGAQMRTGNKAPFPGGMRQLQAQLATGMTSHRTLWLPHLSQPLIQVQRAARSRALLHVPGSALTLPSSICGLVQYPRHAG